MVLLAILIIALLLFTAPMNPLVWLAMGVGAIIIHLGNYIAGLVFKDKSSRFKNKVETFILISGFMLGLITLIYICFEIYVASLNNPAINDTGNSLQVCDEEFHQGGGSTLHYC